MARARWRWSVRGLMAAVAALAVLLGAGLQAARLGWLWGARRQQAAQHSWFEQRWAFFLRIYERRARDRATPEDERARVVALVATARRRIDYHGQMRRKWEQAAGRPWVAVAPDPPPPQ